MRPRVVSIALVISILAMSSSDSSLAQSGRGENREDASAVALCQRPWTVSSQLLRRAIARVAERRLCAASEGLVSVVDDTDRDVATRSMAALALGELGCHLAPRSGRTEGLSLTAIASLESAAAVGQPAALRQSAVRALGRGRVVSAMPTLLLLRADADPIVRYLAAQAATRLSGTDQFDVPFRDAIIHDVIGSATGYQLIDDAEATP